MDSNCYYQPFVTDDVVGTEQVAGVVSMFPVHVHHSENRYLTVENKMEGLLCNTTLTPVPISPRNYNYEQERKLLQRNLS